MKVFGVSGVSTSGKTTIVEKLISELTRRGYSVGSIKSIGCGKSCTNHTSKCGGQHKHGETSFTIDTEGKNSFKHQRAGSKLVATWADRETALIYPEHLEFEEIISKYDFDYVVVEGFKKSELPKVATGITVNSVLSVLSESVFAISGKVAEVEDEIEGIKTYRTFEDIEELTDLVEEVVPDYTFLQGDVELKVSDEEIDVKTAERELSLLIEKLGLTDKNLKIVIEEM